MTSRIRCHAEKTKMNYLIKNFYIYTNNCKCRKCKEQMLTRTDYRKRTCDTRTRTEFQSAPASFASSNERSASERAEWKNYDVLDESAADSEALQPSDTDLRMQSRPDDVARHQHLSGGHWTQVNVISVREPPLFSLKRLTVGSKLFVSERKIESNCEPFFFSTNDERYRYFRNCDILG